MSNICIHLFVSSVRCHFFVFRNSVETLCVSWALSLVECVAEEIRKLSEQSAAGAEQIKNLAQGIMEKSGETVEQADVVKDIIREEQDHIIATREQYQQLEQSIRHSAEEIRKIAGETGRLSQQKEDILGNIGSLSAISEENAANNQQVNANIEEILTQIGRAHV